MKQQVLQYIGEQRLVKAGDRVGVAVSGGPDSVALLRVLLELRAELGVVVTAVLHFNHKLRGAESDADEAFVRALAEKHGLEFRRAEADTASVAEKSGEGIEAAARALRYESFRDTLREQPLDAIATGHTLDDQAETVLMRLLRGSGTRGLAGVLPLVRVHEKRIVRPLLSLRRREVLAYLNAIEQDFREDASNRDKKFLRNRIRHELLPLLERDYNPRVAEALSQTAEIAQAEQQHWERELSEAMRQVARWKWTPGGPTRSLDPGHGVALVVEPFLRLSAALQRLLLQRCCERLGPTPTFEQVEAMRALATKPSGGLDLPEGIRALREGEELRLWAGEKTPSGDYAYPLAVPGEVRLREVGTKIVVRNGAKAGAGSATEASLVVRNWRAGDRFRPRHSKSEKKVKELLTDKKVTGRERELWPVVAAGDRIVWLRGWGMASDAVGAAGSESLEIEEVVTAE